MPCTIIDLSERKVGTTLLLPCVYYTRDPVTKALVATSLDGISIASHLRDKDDNLAITFSITKAVDQVANPGEFAMNGGLISEAPGIYLADIHFTDDATSVVTASMTLRIPIVWAPTHA